MSGHDERVQVVVHPRDQNRADAERLLFVVIDCGDPRFRRYADGSWSFEYDTDKTAHGATWRAAIDAAMRDAEEDA